MKREFKEVNGRHLRSPSPHARFTSSPVYTAQAGFTSSPVHIAHTQILNDLTYYLLYQLLCSHLHFFLNVKLPQALGSFHFLTCMLQRLSSGVSTGLASSVCLCEVPTVVSLQSLLQSCHLLAPPSPVTFAHVISFLKKPNTYHMIILLFTSFFIRI